MDFKLSVWPVRFPVQTPDSEEYAGKYSEGHWHFREWMSCFRVVIESSGKRNTIEGPANDLSQEALTQTMEFAAKAIAKFIEDNDKELSGARLKLKQDLGAI